MTTLADAVLALSLLFVAYTYVGYPALLLVLSATRRRHLAATPPAEWPNISITIPVYNEEAAIGIALERILATDYPPDRRQVLVVSDASTDRTDAIVSGFANRGVELLRMPTRGGKTAAENAAQTLLVGDIIVNTDASIHIPAQSLKPLIAALGDPTVGVASGRDVSVARAGDTTNRGESRYVGYEMWVRELESRVDGIVGASGCFYASRASLHMEMVPEALSRDFGAALIAREHGFRAVSVDRAICFVPRTSSLVREYHRKVRTMVRGMETLYYKGHLLNAARYGLFSWMLFSHKLCRWLVPWALLVALVALAVLAATLPGGRWLGVLLGAGLGVAGVAWVWAARGGAPALLELAALAAAGNLAALHAAVRALRGQLNPIWEPTRRDPAGDAPAQPQAGEARG